MDTLYHFNIKHLNLNATKLLNLLFLMEVSLWFETKDLIFDDYHGATFGSTVDDVQLFLHLFCFNVGNGVIRI